MDDFGILDHNSDISKDEGDPIGGGEVIDPPPKSSNLLC